jgi:16S rRNA (cytidine1402-2'-O)-methyltransferase
VLLRDLAEACGAGRAVVAGRELTKVHEEYWRGTLGAVAERALVDVPRGEFVIVLDGATPAAIDVADEDIVVALRAALAAGASTRQAADDVAQLLGVKRNRAYKLAVANLQVPLRGSGDGSPEG